MKLNRWGLGFATAALLTLTSIGAGFAADWAGQYLTEDSKGNAFTITLSEGGKAAGEKQGHGLEGTWSDAGDAAVIKWTTGWTTKLSKEGDGLMKTAYRPGTPMTGEPASTVSAKRVE